MEMQQQFNQQQTDAPHSTLSLIMGILSLTCGGFICGIIGLIFANKGLKEYNQNPDLYKGKGMLTAGKVMSIIGIVLSVIVILIYAIYAVVLGVALSEIYY
ncbi:MAG: CCC motif membrane protein [Bacteroidales bacterium]|nr:CCC motif membrane protein [Bacteroidales bacterium]MEE1225968.1 CCC motif membrane protein [Bacteroidales bacterium]